MCPMKSLQFFITVRTRNRNLLLQKLANKFERKFKYLGKNTEKCKTFSVPIGVTKIDKDGNESVLTISYKIKFIDSARFMATSLLNRVDNLTEGIHKIECKNFDCFLECESVKENSIKYKCTSCNKDCSN